MTVHAVAAHAGVSPQTVSRVLRGRGYVSAETRAKVLASVEALGYRPNAVGQALRSTRTKLVGLIVSDVTNPFYARLHRAVERVLAAEGLSLMLLNTGDDADEDKPPTIDPSLTEAEHILQDYVAALKGNVLTAGQVAPDLNRKE